MGNWESLIVVVDDDDEVLGIYVMRSFLQSWTTLTVGAIGLNSFQWFPIYFVILIVDVNKQSL